MPCTAIMHGSHARQSLTAVMHSIHAQQPCTAISSRQPCTPPACRHLARVPDYLWVAEDGMKMQGYNGSQLWDTSFAVQALAAAGLLRVTGQALKRAHQYVDVSQVGAAAAAAAACAAPALVGGMA